MSATPSQYANIFVGHPDGVAILEDLMTLHYDGNLHVSGDTEATFMNLGGREVIRRILRRIAVAQQGDPNEEQDGNS